MKKTILAFLVLVLSVYCAHPWVGKTLPANTYPQFSQGLEGHHLIQFEGGKADLEYDWLINTEESTITLDGAFNIHTTEWEMFSSSPDRLGRMKILAFFLNRNYTIVQAGTIFFPIDSETKVEENFKKTFPYKKEYKFITFRIEYQGVY